MTVPPSPSSPSSRRRAVAVVLALASAGTAAAVALSAPALAGATSTLARTATGLVAGTTVGGAHVRYLPDGLGVPSDFSYEFDDVAFVSRDWESRHDGGWRVDLSIDVLRGSPLADPETTHDWVVAYEERPPANAVYHRVRVNGHPGWRSSDEVFWFARRGVAVVVRLDTARWSQHTLTRIADGIRLA